MTEQLRTAYLEALIATVPVAPSPELFDRIERLLGIAGAIAQPEQALEDGHAVSADLPAPATQPASAGSAALAVAAAGEEEARASSPIHTPDQGSSIAPGAATAPAIPVPPGARPAPAPTAVPGVFCRFCHRPFPSRRGIHNHERRCESNPDRLPPWVPTPEGTASGPPPPVAPAVESFLCDRCGEPFQSRQALAEHRRGHPEIPPAAPLRRAFRGPVDSVLGGTG